VFGTVRRKAIVSTLACAAVIAALAVAGGSIAAAGTTDETTAGDLVPDAVAGAPKITAAAQSAPRRRSWRRSRPDDAAAPIRAPA
jgi:hypothetical protein